jgi:hypothetical protein
MFRVVRRGEKRATRSSPGREAGDPLTSVTFPGIAPEARSHCTGLDPDCRAAGVKLANHPLGLMLQGLPHSRYVTCITALAGRKSDTGAGE